jgi:hypothetical protein
MRAPSTVHPRVPCDQITGSQLAGSVITPTI